MSAQSLFREELQKIPADVKRQVDLSFAIADRIDSLLRRKNITQKELARTMGKTEAEVSRWLTGRHNFTLRTISAIETALGENLIVALPMQYHIAEDEPTKVAEEPLM